MSAAKRRIVFSYEKGGLKLTHFGRFKIDPPEGENRRGVISLNRDRLFILSLWRQGSVTCGQIKHPDTSIEKPETRNRDRLFIPDIASAGKLHVLEAANLRWQDFIRDRLKITGMLEILPGAGIIIGHEIIQVEGEGAERGVSLRDARGGRRDAVG